MVTYSSRKEGRIESGCVVNTGFSPKITLTAFNVYTVLLVSSRRTEARSHFVHKLRVLSVRKVCAIKLKICPEQLVKQRRGVPRITLMNDFARHCSEQ